MSRVQISPGPTRDYLIRAIIFDIGGVIVVSKAGRQGAAESMGRRNALVAKSLGVDPTILGGAYNRHSHEAELGGITRREFLQRMAKDTGARPKDIQDAWTSAYARLFKVNAPLIRIVRRLKENGYVVATLTNSTPLSDYARARFGIYREFDTAVVSHRCGVAKPDRAAYGVLLRKLGLKADECVFVDDLTKHIASARRLGFRTILFKDAATTMGRLRQLGVRV